MADNIAITAGTGTTVATDDVGGAHFQKVKLVDGTADASTAIAAGGGVEAGALRVTIANDSTGVVSVDDNGGTLTVDGTVTANLSATDNTVLDNIDADTSAIQTAVELIDDAVFAEDVAAQAADKGMAILAVRRDADTSLVGADNDYANLQVNATGALKVEIFDGGDSHTIDGTVTANLSATDNAVLDAIEADTTTLAGAVSGTEMQVDVLTMPTTTVQATNLDIRDLTATDVVTANLSATDNAVLDNIDSDTSAIQTAVELLDDTVYVDDADWTDNTSKHTLVGGVYQSTQHTVTDGDVSPIAVDSNGNVRVNVVAGSAAGTEFDEDTPHTTADAGTLMLAVRRDTPAVGSDTDGDYSTLNVGSGGRLYTSATIDAALPAGTNAIGKLAANSGVDIGDVDVTSVIPGTGATNLGKAIDTATGATDTGVLALGTRDDVLATLTPVDGDNVQTRTDKYGATWVESVPTEADLATMSTAHVKKYYTNSGAVTDGIVWSPAAGKRWYITSIFINVSAAATVTLEDDLSGGDSAIWKAELAANSGWSSTFPVPWFSGEDAADLIITTSAGNVYVTVVGYEI